MEFQCNSMLLLLSIVRTKNDSGLHSGPMTGVFGGPPLTKLTVPKTIIHNFSSAQCCQCGKPLTVRV